MDLEGVLFKNFKFIFDQYLNYDYYQRHTIGANECMTLPQFLYSHLPLSYASGDSRKQLFGII